ncbi:MAG: peptidase associated/transthyretin-like domain-containing protein [Thermodesulfovibrionales bacterium]
MRIILQITLIFLCMTAALPAYALTCSPTPPDVLGPFYKTGAPVRGSVGKGYLLQGSARSAKDCRPIEGAKIEFWMAGPDGEYQDRYRSTLYSGKSGSYSFGSHFPPPYAGRPPHIHIRVSAPGHQTLVTQHYPLQGSGKAQLDLVLVPDN